MALHTLARHRRYGLNDYSSDPIIFLAINSSLSGWTTSGASIQAAVGNPAPSILCPGGSSYAYNYVRRSGGLVDTTIWLQMRTTGGTPLCNFYFGCNSSGTGQMWRLEGRGSAGGFTTTSSWGGWSSPSNGNVFSPNVWYQIKFFINSARLTTLWVNGVLQPNTYTMANTGPYFAYHGDGGTGGYFQDLRIVSGYSPTIY